MSSGPFRTPAEVVSAPPPERDRRLPLGALAGLVVTLTIPLFLIAPYLLVRTRHNAFRLGCWTGYSLLHLFLAVVLFFVFVWPDPGEYPPVIVVPLLLPVFPPHFASWVARAGRTTYTPFHKILFSHPFVQWDELDLKSTVKHWIKTENDDGGMPWLRT